MYVPTGLGKLSAKSVSYLVCTRQTQAIPVCRVGAREDPETEVAGSKTVKTQAGNIKAVEISPKASKSLGIIGRWVETESPRGIELHRDRRRDGF